jgi:hypothetical protein
VEKDMGHLPTELRERSLHVCDGSAIYCEASMEMLERAANEIERLTAEVSGLRAACLALLDYEADGAKLMHGMSDCSCMTRSRDAERAYETGKCPHQVAHGILEHKE